MIEIKKDVNALNTRYNNLKKRALKLNEQREENINLLEQKKKKELDEEEKLEAKIVLATNEANGENKHNNKKVVKIKTKKTATTVPSDSSELNDEIDKNQLK